MKNYYDDLHKITLSDSESFAQTNFAAGSYTVHHAKRLYSRCGNQLLKYFPPQFYLSLICIASKE